MRIYPDAACRRVYDPFDGSKTADKAHFIAWSPASRVVFGYEWGPLGFSLAGNLGRIMNHSRTSPPWNSETLTRGMEFGGFAVSGAAAQDD